MSDELPQASSDARKSHLASAVQQEVASGGRVESQSDYTAVIRYGKEVDHKLHLLITFFTCGLWGLVWLVLWIVSESGKKAVTLTVDEYGQVLRQEL
ncbi:hypothetical protein OG542_20580 [Streptomyces violaceus]|uniref:hypothetical protein n=1 Tax=Streptomyces violaceus TaxID=1936 RepID=UPI002E1FDAEB